MNTRNAGRLASAAGMAALGVVAGLALGRARHMAAKAAMTLTGDWEKQMKAEHRALGKLLRSLAASRTEDGARRAALVAAIGDVLAKHALEEENVVYPELQTAGLSSAVAELLGDHADMRLLLRELEETAPEDPAFAETARRLKALVERHMRKEERELFPLLHEGALDGETERLTRLVRREGLRVS
jgi:iron-sulfur cluster repair protein YtfE (RIC family)